MTTDPQVIIPFPAATAAPVQPGLPPQTDVQPMPVDLAPSTPFIPKEYEIHLHSQLCLSCGSGHEWTSVYAFNQHGPRLAAGKRISHLHKVQRFSYNVPTRVVRAPTETVPACQECALSNLDLSHLPRPANTAEYQQILNSFAAGQAAPAAPAKPTKPTTTTTKIRTVSDLF